MGTTRIPFPHNTNSHSQEAMAKRHADELLNGTTFDYVVSTSPRAYTTERKVNFNRTVHTVRRVLVVKLRVARKHKSPEGITFVPLFLTTDDDLLDPSTCDAVGRLVGDLVQLNPSFVHTHENASKRVKALTVRFEMEEDMDLLNDLDLPDDVMGPAQGNPVHPVSRKCAVKSYPTMGRGKVPPSWHNDDNDEGEQDEQSEDDIQDSELEEEEGTGTDLDEDISPSVGGKESAKGEEEEVPRRPSGKDPRVFGFRK